MDTKETENEMDLESAVLQINRLILTFFSLLIVIIHIHSRSHKRSISFYPLICCRVSGVGTLFRDPIFNTYNATKVASLTTEK